MMRCIKTNNLQKPIPWYSLNPRHIRVRRILLPLAILLLLSLCNEKHLWQWAWRDGYHAGFNCQPVVDARGRNIEAWRWVEGKTIRIYTSPYLATGHVRLAAASMRSLVADLGLDVNIELLPLPKRVEDALARSTSMRGHTRWLSFDRLCRELVATRDGAYAEMVYVPEMIDSSPDVTGAAVFKYGVGVLNARQATSFTARHETAHLLGYHMHDTWPLIVLGYSNPQWAIYQHDHHASEPLMMPNDTGDELSPRSRDALICFWHGLERRTKHHYFAP